MIPVTASLVRCYSDYMHTEYGDLDSDYVFVNLWGCCGFMIAAVYSIILPGGTPESFATLSLAWTLQGAVCFFAGSVLMLPETALEESTNGTCERRTSNDRRGSCTGFECDCAQVGLEPGRGGWQ